MRVERTSSVSSLTVVLTVCRRNTDEYKDSCPAQVDAFRKKASGLIGGLVEDLENQFKDNVKVLCCRAQAGAGYSLSNSWCFRQVLLPLSESRVFCR